MKVQKLHTCLMLLLVIAGGARLIAQNSYQTDLLARMAASMQITSQLNVLEEGIYWKQIKYDGKPLTVIVQNKQIEHIGYALFTPGQRLINPSPVYNFLERYSLEINLPLEREKAVARQIAEDDISFEQGTFSSFQTLLIDTMFNVSIENNNGKRYTVSWQKAGAIYCSVNFPVSYDLLHGSEMLENEKRIKQRILDAPVLRLTPQKVNSKILLPTWQSNYFILPGESYYTDELNTNRYYELGSDGKYYLLYQSGYPLESLANLLTTLEIENEFVINIKLKKYGNEEELITVPLNRWTSFCLSTGCKPFFGVISYEGNFAVCELIIRNVEEGYNHVLKIVFDVTQLEERKGIIQARLNSYIPFSKIKYLFDEIRQ